MSNLKTKLAWDQIDWTKVQQRIFRIQRRIYRAKTKQNITVVYYLQNKLINSLDAKLLAVNQAICLKNRENTKKIQLNDDLTGQKKWQLANSLKLNEKSSHSCQRPITMSSKQKPTIVLLKDLAKQNLVKMALEPEWEAVFENSVYGFRPGRHYYDAIEQIFINIQSEPKYVINAKIEDLTQLNCDLLLKKLNTISNIKNQLKIWLNANIFTDDSKETFEYEKSIFKGGILTPLLLNIAFHGLETHLNQWYSNLNHLNKDHPQSAKQISFIRYGENFVIITPEQVTEEAKFVVEKWFLNIGLNKIKTHICCTTTGFNFLGFHIILINKNHKYRCRIHISRESKKELLIKTRLIIQNNKASSSYILIKKLTPILLQWATYFQYSQCLKDFQKIDQAIFGQLRAWVFRRKAPGMNRHALKEKYFPSGNIYKFKGKTFKNNWILCGQSKTLNGKIIKNYLPKLSWISRQKFLKIKENASIFNSDHIYWTLKLKNYSHFKPRLSHLIRLQKGQCALCQKTFSPIDQMKIICFDSLSHSNQSSCVHSQVVHKNCLLSKASF
uniref:Putative reverse transcriptase and intron maturase n=1 Tax=Sykidion marinum TaxID=44573 RepID=A0A1W6EGM3_SYKMA|nr:putative reverse transcriptase and intron maturase [Pseudoneochloris marina]ARK14543.1 putative reverse transcriptase and intron maturase [Pseudoneochloris marina]